MAERKRNRSNFGVRGLGAEESKKSQPATPKPSQSPPPSPARLAERSGLGRGVYSNRDYYNTATYSLPDVASLGRGISQTRRGDVQPAYKPTARGGRGDYDNPNVPTRAMAGGRPRVGGGSDAVDARRRRKASTKATYREIEAAPAIRSQEIQDQNKTAARREAIRTRETYEPADRGALFEAENTGWSAHVKHERGSQANRQEYTYGAADFGMASDALISWENNRAAARDADRWATGNNALGRADASMADSRVTPPSVPIEQKKSRGRIRRNDRNIQAFY